MVPLNSSAEGARHEDSPLQGLRREDEEERPDERRQAEVEMPLVRGLADDHVRHDPGTSQGVPQLVAVEGHTRRDVRSRADPQEAGEMLLVHIAHAPADLRGALRAWLHRREREGAKTWSGGDKLVWEQHHKDPFPFLSVLPDTLCPIFRKTTFEQCDRETPAT